MDGWIREEACSSEIVSWYPVKQIVWAKKTAYADVILAECPGLGMTLFLDQEIQSAARDEYIYHECLVHPVMAAAPCRKRVLIVGGGEGATAREVLKWPEVEEVVWVDIDGELVEACQKYMGWLPETQRTDPRLQYFAEDIREYLKQTNTRFDVILIDLPDPNLRLSIYDDDNLQNLKFWEGIRSVLTAEGVFAMHVGPTVLPGDPDPFSWTLNGVKEAGLSVNPSAYHAVIPSFQNDWSFLMSCPPNFAPLPFSCRFLTESAHRYIFTWAQNPLN